MAAVFSTEKANSPEGGRVAGGDVIAAGVAMQLAEDAAKVEYSPWSRGLIRLYGCLLVAYMCGCLNGYDSSLMGGLNAMTAYQQFFHM
jgi:hypothetical protein